MSELIRRSDVIAIIQNAKYKFPTWPHIAEAKEDMVQAIKSAQTADVVPVVHARWIICSDGYYPYCSECHEEPKSRELTNYCPNCGAKMDGERRESEVTP